MTLTCKSCGRQHPMTEEDIAYFHPRFFCLSCGRKLEFNLPEAKIYELRQSNDPARSFAEGDLQSLPPLAEPRKVAKGAVDLESNG